MPRLWLSDIELIFSFRWSYLGVFNLLRVGDPALFLFNHLISKRPIGALATKVVAGKIRGIEDFIPFVKKATLARVKHAMDELLKIVSDDLDPI